MSMDGETSSYSTLNFLLLTSITHLDDDVVSNGYVLERYAALLRSRSVSRCEGATEGLRSVPCHCPKLGLLVYCLNNNPLSFSFKGERFVVDACTVISVGNKSGLRFIIYSTVPFPP